MRIHRQESGLKFRRERRRSGCFSLFVLIGVMISVALLTWNRVEQWLANTLGTPSHASLQSAHRAFTDGDLNTAIDIAGRILNENPDNLDALTLLIRALIYRSYIDYNRAEDRAAALRFTTAALARAPQNIHVQAVHAFALQANGQSEIAGRFASRVLEKQPQNMPALTALALSYGGQGVFEWGLRESLNAVDTATTHASDWRFDSLRVLATAYSDLGRYEEALQTIEKAIDNNGRMIFLQFERALYALQIGDMDTATVAYFQVLSLDPQNVKARLRLCEVSSTLREREAALRYCSEVTELAPEWSEGWYRLGREYFLEGNYASAQQSFHRCTTLQQLHGVPIPERRFECWYLQGQSAELRGDCEGLVDTYNEFLEMATMANLTQTWIYPPEGPTSCVTPTPATP